MCQPKRSFLEKAVIVGIVTIIIGVMLQISGLFDRWWIEHLFWTHAAQVHRLDGREALCFQAAKEDELDCFVFYQTSDGHWDNHREHCTREGCASE